MKQYILNNMRAHLGQHFLVNHAAAQRSIDALHLEAGDIVIEIGPGKEALTNRLISALNKQQIARLILVEKDPVLAETLRNKYTDPNLISVINDDILEALPALTEQLHGSYKIIGNIPYYITGRLLRIIGELSNKPTVTVLMTQKEVAERVIAEPPHMNLLAAATQFWSVPQIVCTLEPKDFLPPPKVESAVITLHTKVQEPNATAYYQAIHEIFRQPRKTVLNNARALLGKDAADKLKKLDIDPKSRPQNLSIADLKKIAGLSTE